MPPNQLSATDNLFSADDIQYIASIRALQSPLAEGTATHPGLPSLPTPRALSEHFSHLIYSWIPHPFTPAETQAVRLGGTRYLMLAREIEKVKRDIHPRVLPLESYQLRYFRTFRMNDLPTEIIANILRLVVWSTYTSMVDARLRVTSTCRRWRDIALADVTLWNAIWFRPGARIERTWAWFDRARKAPLDIRVDERDLADEPEGEASASPTNQQSSRPPNEIRQILSRIFTKLTSIRMLIITTEDWGVALAVIELAKAGGPNGMPLLERFEIHRGGRRQTHTFPPAMVQAFPVAPALTYLALNSVPIDWSRSVLENLTTFDIRCLPPALSPDLPRFREILRKCPRLEKLSLDGAGPQFEEPGTDDLPPVQLPHLHTLNIGDFKCRYAMFLFSQFSAPNVNYLSFLNLCGEDFLPLILQITAQFPKVRLLSTYSLQFDTSPLGVATMTKWLDSMPLLAYLQVANVPALFWAAFFRVGPPSTGLIAPNLTAVSVTAVNRAIFVRWAKDRHAFGTPLEKIYVSQAIKDKLSTEQIRDLTRLCTVAMLPEGGTTPEEDALTL
ncbi:hypothetical protein FB451DRAFT_1262857 [Mycena latifolia]|nr:hypothetical protein FB451DRAFT_1262857 [Mycena latifolia]